MISSVNFLGEAEIAPTLFILLLAQVTRFALAKCIHDAPLVLARKSKFGPTLPQVTVFAHAFRIILGRGVFALSDQQLAPTFATRLYRLHFEDACGAA